MTTYKGCELPGEVYYDLDYVWARPESDHTVILGITDPAQTFAGRILRIRIKFPGQHVEQQRQVATLESGKWAGGVPIPFPGTILERNEKLFEDPHLINIDPYHEAWIVKVRPDNFDDAFAQLKTGDIALAALQAWIDRYDIQCLRCT